MGGPRSYCPFMKLCSQITFGAQNATKRLRKHTNDYHAMTSCHRALVVDAGSFSGYLWSILMGEPQSYCPFMKLCSQITFCAQIATKRLRKHTNDYHAMTSCHRALAVDAGSFSWYLWSILMGEPRSYCLFMKLCSQITFGAHKMQQNTWENTQMTITQWPHAIEL